MNQVTPTEQFSNTIDLKVNPTSPVLIETQPSKLDIPSYLGLTYQIPDGNRYIEGKGSMLNSVPLEISLPGIPIWIVGAPAPDGVLWTAALSNGDFASYVTSAEGVSPFPLQTATANPGAPIAAQTVGGLYSIIEVPDPDQSDLTHPINLPQSNARAYISSSGELKIVDYDDREITKLSIAALPDARILSDDQDRMLLLTNPTDKYNHGVLGDSIEASGITLIDSEPEFQVSSTISLEENEVIEGIAPIWVDVNGDKQREIIVTVSDLNLGAGIVIFNENGQKLAEGQKMGQPYRWRHQIAYAAVGPNGENELIVVRTPHIAGTVEFYRMIGGDLELLAEYLGITSHTIGSRNLDMAAVGDFDGDGSAELLLPNPKLTELVAVIRTTGGAEEKWRLPIDGEITTNLAGVSLPDDKLAAGVGTNGGKLMIWLP